MATHKKQRRRYLTLIEIMIVITLIGLIGGVLAYNMRGSLEKGKAFKTRQAIAQVENILLLAQTEGKEFDNESWTTVIDTSPLVKNKESVKKDGWGQQLKLVKETDGNLTITSEALKSYEEKNGKNS
jgi:general secretion pathway protein G